MQNQHAEPSIPARGSLAMRIAPARARPFLELARSDKPIGTWLLFFPCAWAFVLAITSVGVSQLSMRHVGILLLLGLGALLMRGAGCSWNDILDRNIDKQVDRSKSRPLAAGRISLTQAVAFLFAQLAVAFIVLLQFNPFTVKLALIVMPLVAFYPLAKQVTQMPQIFLGFTFAWGALVGWGAVTGTLAIAPFILYIGCIAWTVGYDTIYAHQARTRIERAAVGRVIAHSRRRLLCHHRRRACARRCVCRKRMDVLCMHAVHYRASVVATHPF